MDTDLEKLLLRHVNHPDYRPVKPRVIAKQLVLTKDENREMKKLLKRLVKKGLVFYGANHLVYPPSENVGNRVSGVFQRNPKGFGFVRPSGASHPAQEKSDIYVPARHTKDAATGDLVLVRVGRKRGREGRITGEIVKILERETHRFVGTYYEASGVGFVRVDGGVFTSAVAVGDPGAKNVRPDDKVVIEMVRFPAHSHDGEGVIVEVLGPRGEPGVDTLSVIHQFGLPQEFPEDVLDAARTQADAFDESIGQDRRDLSELTVITIDPEDARDFDDAISLERIENGHWQLGVHIADVAHFVRPKTPLDREARERATSVYLPDRVLPMLPEIISNNLASLQPDRVRYAKSVFMEFTPDGTPVTTEYCSAAIKSARRFTYEEVDAFLAHRSRWKKKLTPDVHSLLGRMHALAMILRGRRMDRGAIELAMPEIELDLDADGRVCGAHVEEHTESHQIIEEFMLAANEAVAQLLSDQGLLFLRRIHEPPNPRKMHALTEFVRELGIPCESMESRFEIKRVLAGVQERPEQRAVHYAVLRSMQKAVYSPKVAGHYALASNNYCHFTSPIRRYPDLTVHRLLDALARKRTPVQNIDQLYTVAEHCSDREQRAERAERELIKIKLLEYFEQRIGEKMGAVITGIERFGLFVQGLELPADGLVPIHSLQDDYYVFDAAAHSLTGRKAGNCYRLGDLVEVEVARVDLDDRELDFRLVGRLKRPPRGAAQARSATQKSRQKKTAKKKPTTRKTQPVKKSKKQKTTDKVTAEKKRARKKTARR
jgi:ribonuclease R